MRHYRVVSAFSLGGGKDVYVGDIIQLDDVAGRAKIGQGFVVLVADEVKVLSVDADAVAVEHGDPSIRRRTSVQGR